MTGADHDPVRARRARIGRWAGTGRRAGYALFGAAVAAFAVGAATRFTPPTVATVVACLAVGSALLAPSIVIGYGVRAAEREERAGGGRTRSPRRR